MKRLFWILPLILLGALGVYFWRENGKPPLVETVNASRVRLETRIATNGKVEPIGEALVKAASAGKVVRIAVKQGDVVAAGQVLVELDSAEIRAQLNGVEARIATAEAEAKVIEAGGSHARLTELDNQMAVVRQQLSTAEADLATNERLRSRQAATEQQVLDAKRRVYQLKIDLAGVERARSAVVQDSDRVVANSRINAARSEAAQLRSRLNNSVLSAPTSGTLYVFSLKPGAYLNVGDEIGRIGQTKTVRVQVYVDEPDLGKLRLGTPVDISWDAHPGRIWNGSVERLATQVVALGSRQVGEIFVSVDNADGTLLPGTNINADVKVAVLENALSIPREALRRQNERDGVLVFDQGVVKFRAVEIGASSASRFEVRSGIDAKDSVILPADFELKEGMAVRVER
jgi:HlyD family secretion protein